MHIASHKKYKLIITVLQFVFYSTCLCGLILAGESQAQSVPQSGITSNAKDFIVPESTPNPADPLVIEASFHLNNLNRIDDIEQAVEFSGVLTLTWLDPRQAFDPEVAGVSEKNYHGDFQFNELAPAWYPQVFLANELGVYEKRGTILRVLPDGTSILKEVVHGVARSQINLTKFPFDRHKLEAQFQILGYNENDVVFRVKKDRAKIYAKDVIIPQWNFVDSSEKISSRLLPNAQGDVAKSSTYVITFEVARQSFFVVRLVFIPVILITILSWAVFWMERSSLGDRIGVSFIGILTTVSYQILISEITPHVSYFTIATALLWVSFLTMSATVVINLWVGACDRRGKSQYGDLIDYRCRWIFPLVYCLLSLAVLAFGLLY